MNTSVIRNIKNTIKFSSLYKAKHAPLFIIGNVAGIILSPYAINIIESKRELTHNNKLGLMFGIGVFGSGFYYISIPLALVSIYK